MSLPDRHAVFVAPYLLPATLRFISAAAALPESILSLVSTDPAERIPAALRARLAGHYRVEDCFDAAQLVDAVARLGRHLAPVERLIGSLEQLQVPLAAARAELGLPGMPVEVAHAFRDKHRMKAAFAEAGLPCARYALITGSDSARAFVAEVGLPIVVKPTAGAGAAATYRLETLEQLEQYVDLHRPNEQHPTLAEEFLRGDEYSCDCVMQAGRLVWHSISAYRPNPLTVIENPWIQWCVLLPREIDTPEFAGVSPAAERALQALGLRDGLAHLEWFRRDDGGIALSEVAARPPGAQFTTLLSYAHDHDFYRAWARLMVFDAFVPPTRRYAAGAAYLRGQGTGRVRRVHGTAEIQRDFGELIVEVAWPRPGVAQAEGYEGSGYVLFRHASTGRVEEALRRTVATVRVELAAV